MSNAKQEMNTRIAQLKSELEVLERAREQKRREVNAVVPDIVQKRQQLADAEEALRLWDKASKL